jgi:hypothetical protein
MLYLTEDGRKFFAANANDFVAKLRKGDWGTSENDAAFMVEIAERARMIDRTIEIATDTSENFLRSLIEVGLITTKESR